MLQTEILSWLLAFLRASAFLAVFPVFSSTHFPVQVRIALGALLAALVYPLITPVPTAKTFIGILVIMTSEVFIGLLLGFVSRMVFFAVDFAGGLIAAQMGLTFTPDLDPFTSNESQTPGLILYFLAGMLLFSLDLHHWVIVGYSRSYQVLPIAGAHLHEAALVDIIRRTGEVFGIGLQMAAPIIAISFIITMMLSILGRAVPQMHVFSESFAVRTLVGIAVFGLTLNIMAQHIVNFLRRLPEDVLRIAKLLGT